VSEPQPVIHVVVTGWTGLELGGNERAPNGDIVWHPREDLERRLTEAWAGWMERWVYTGPGEIEHVRPALRVKVRVE
jgi:hypothetical protein